MKIEELLNLKERLVYLEIEQAKAQQRLKVLKDQFVPNPEEYLKNYDRVLFCIEVLQPFTKGSVLVSSGGRVIPLVKTYMADILLIEQYDGYFEIHKDRYGDGRHKYIEIEPVLLEYIKKYKSISQEEL